MVTNPDSWKHLFLADSCPQAETENTHLISSHSPDIGFRVLVTSSCSCDREGGSQTPRYGFVIVYLTSPQNCNYLYTCSCDVRQAWGTEIVCENLYCSVANEKTTIKSLYRSSPKGLLKCLRKVLFPLVLETDRDSQGTCNKY